MGNSRADRYTSAEMDQIDLAALDPGIRNVVAHLRAAGFDTTDSGDGRTKNLSDPEVLPFAHVVIDSMPTDLLADAHDLHNVATDACATVGFPSGFQIEATYDPADSSAIIMLSWPGPL